MKTITTQKVNCKDCHRCVRSCPIKAIAIEKGHARLVDEKCILCGKCVVECPQHAKQVRNNTSLIKAVMAKGERVVMSLAPSFIGAFPEYSPEQLVAAIKKLGFAAVEETAIGAEVVSDFYKSMLDTAEKTIISACCPVVVNLITKYYPSLVDCLAPVVSPMMAHGQIIKNRLPDAFVVFTGPCIGKIDEALADNSSIDAVLTFQQLKEWLVEADEQWDCGAFLQEFDASAKSNARYFPIAGGILKSFMQHEGTDTEIIAIDGIRQCMQVFESLERKEISPRFIEALACIGGCINGPAVGNDQCIPAKRVKVVQFARKKIELCPAKTNYSLDFSRVHNARVITSNMPNEIQIQEILNKTGKVNKAKEKNCGACGYNSCRENAIAVFQGLTEIDTCVPYMRSKAESFANIIVANSLNAIIVVDEKMIIQEFNPAAEYMFNRQKEIMKGISLAEIIDCADLVHAAQTGIKTVGKRVEFSRYGLITEQMIIPVREHGLIITIISDVTDQEKRHKALEKMKMDTVEKATEIINKQMQVAQEIAGLLGETTAETKTALLEMIMLIKEKGEK